MNKKIIWSIVVVIIIGIIIFTGISRNDSKNESVVKIGLIMPLTGDLGFMGEQMKVGSDLAERELNKNGQRVQLIYEDDKFDPKVTASAANKLISIDKIDTAIMFTVEELRPVVTIFTNAKVPLLAAWDSNVFLRDAGPYIFSNGFSTERAGAHMADYAYDTLKIRKVAVLSHIDAWSEIVAKNFEEQFKKKGGIIVYNEAVQIGTDNFRTHIAKIKQAGADGVYFPLIPFDNQNFVKQSRENKLNIPLMTGDALLPEVIEALGSDGNGVYFTNGYAENPMEGLNIYAQVAYDAVMKIMSNPKNGSDIKKTLDETFGPSRTADRTEKVFEIKNGIPVPIEK